MRGELAGTAWISGCLLLCLAAPIAGAQGLTIELEGVPEQLGFPVPPGLNLVLTARISGGEARDVWLAEKRDARMRLHLDRVARGVYQINLGEPEVRDALGRKTAGSFRVFASDAEGRVVQSIAVRYGPRRRVHARLKPVVVGTGWTRVLGPASPWRPNWCDISKVERLEVRIEGDRVAAHAEARVGAAKFPFDTDAKTGHLVLEMTSALRTAWQNAGTLAILHQLPMKDPLRVEVRAVPERIDLPRGAKMFTLTQRAYHHFAECRGYVKLRIGDITAGQVEADLWIATQRVVTDRRLVRGDRLHFNVGKHRYTILLVRLVNFLIGDDYAVLVLYEKQIPEAIQIETLIRMVRNVPAFFYRGDTRLERNALEKDLTSFNAGWKPETKTLAGFVAAVSESPCGKDVTVRLFDRTDHVLRDWLGKQAEVFSEPAKKADAVKPGTVLTGRRLNAYP